MAKGSRGTGQLPGISDKQHWGTRMVVAQPIRGAGGVLPSGVGTGITCDAGRRHALALKGVSGSDRITTHIHSRGTITTHNNSGKNRDGFGNLRSAAEEHHDCRRVLKRCGIR